MKEAPIKARHKLAAIGIIGSSFVGLSYGLSSIADANYGKEKASQYLRDSGYSDIEFKKTDKMFASLRGCDKTDYVLYDFKAKGLNAKEVDILVCKGLFKGATIRQG